MMSQHKVLIMGCTWIIRMICAIVLVVTLANGQACKQCFNCHLPYCFCSTFNHPMNRTNIPQMVYFGFDGSLDSSSMEYYDVLFRHEFINPNDCPISATLFITHNKTDHEESRKLYNCGFDLAVSDASNAIHDIGFNIINDVRDHRTMLSKHVGVPLADIGGWRSPDLIAMGDLQFLALLKSHYTYDSSLTYTKTNINDSDVWPFTLDFGWPYKSTCSSWCPQDQHHGLWVVPVTSLILNGEPCTYADSCEDRLSDSNATFKYLMDNFNSHYHGNRAPFGINIHSTDFLGRHSEVLERFITTVLDYGDVYIVNIQQLLEWMKNPTPLSDIRAFEPWCTSLVIQERERNDPKGTPNELTVGEKILLDILILVSSVGILHILSIVVEKVYPNVCRRQTRSLHMYEAIPLTQDDIYM
ncbi:chitin deacetylase 8-like [Argopecten irradians]|uniref:chitin deacetylase 8-like n=1 Tax=Argopecten irradians TaxID=31199 RepID=UPI00371E9A55